MPASKNSHKNPPAHTRLARFVKRRILELSGTKSQKEIARESGFVNVNVLSMVKNGMTKLPLDRVPALAAALGTDPRALFSMAFEQTGHETALRALEDIINTIVSENELAWLEEIRAASGGADPRLTARARTAIRALF